MKTKRHLTILLLAILASQSVAQSSLDPRAFISLGGLKVPHGATYKASTDDLILRDSNNVIIATGILVDGKAIFTFSDIWLAPGARLELQGSRGAAVLSQSEIFLSAGSTMIILPSGSSQNGAQGNNGSNGAQGSVPGGPGGAGTGGFAGTAGIGIGTGGTGGNGGGGGEGGIGRTGGPSIPSGGNGGSGGAGGSGGSGARGGNGFQGRSLEVVASLGLLNYGVISAPGSNGGNGGQGGQGGNGAPGGKGGNGFQLGFGGNGGTGGKGGSGGQGGRAGDGAQGGNVLAQGFSVLAAGSLSAPGGLAGVPGIGGSGGSGGPGGARGENIPFERPGQPGQPGSNGAQGSAGGVGVPGQAGTTLLFQDSGSVELVLELTGDGNVLGDIDLVLTESGTPYSFSRSALVSASFAEIVGLAPQMYEIDTKPKGFLRRKVTVDLTTGSTVAPLNLLAGDIDNTNTIDLLDYFALSEHYGLDSSWPFWNTIGVIGSAPVDADLNRDESVDLLDYFILSSNYGLEGD